MTVDKNVLQEQIEEFIFPVLEGSGLELFDINIKMSGRKATIQLLVDKPEGGIQLNECARLNKLLGDYLEENQVMQVPYLLDVSSPGLDRPLRSFQDFRRAKGHDVRLVLSTADEGKLEYTGQICEVTAQEVVVQTSEGQKAFSFANIKFGKQIIK